MARPFTFYEFFAGGGMARLGLGPAWACAFANDFDPVKAATYRANFPDAERHFREGDVFGLDAADLPGRADLAWASSPCQDFSLAGGRAGLAGGRSSAFFGFWRLMEALDDAGRAPRAIVIENVTGLLSSHGGADFEAVVAALAGRGYKVGAVEIDAARFVPQSRPRLFIICTREAVPKHLSCIDAVRPFHSRRVEEAHAALPRHLQVAWVWWKLPYPPATNATLESILEEDDAVVWFSEERTQKLRFLLGDRHREKIKDAQGRGHRSVGALFRRMRLEDGKRVQRAEVRFDGLAGCLRTPAGGSSKQTIVVVDGPRVRARHLTSREAGRLMGLADDYSFPSAKTSALKVAGDGVVVPVVRFLSENLLLSLIEQGDSCAHAEEPEQHMAIPR